MIEFLTAALRFLRPGLALYFAGVFICAALLWMPESVDIQLGITQEFYTANRLWFGLGLLACSAILSGEALVAWGPGAAGYAFDRCRRIGMLIRFRSLETAEKALLAYMVVRHSQEFVADRRWVFVQSLVDKHIIRYRMEMRGELCFYEVTDRWWAFLHAFRKTVADSCDGQDKATKVVLQMLGQVQF